MAKIPELIPKLAGSNVRFEYLPLSNILPGRDTSIARLRRWIDECLSNHQSCSKHTSEENVVRPTRLLDLNLIYQDNESGIRLIETSPDNVYRYACLSHRWDASLQRHRATKDNLPNLLNFLPIRPLPANFRDAISIARELGIQYLWIDSLCIIQEGDDHADLVQELGKMGFIYRNAWLTIAAVSSPNSSGGCFIRDKWPDVCFSVNTTEGSHLIGCRVLDKNGKPKTAHDIDSHYPLLTRGWVFQECFLSPRLLQCNYGEFTFRCLESSSCECNSHLAPHPQNTAYMSRWIGKMDMINRQVLFVSDFKNSGLENAWHWQLKIWRALVGTYTKLKLTNSDDMLPAVAGCAQIFASRLRFNYVAGLWKERIQTELLWHVKLLYKHSKPRPKDSTAPSWSWASVAMGQHIQLDDYDKTNGDGRKRYDKKQLLLDIKDICCVPESTANPFGKLKYAYLKLHAKLYPWHLRLLCPAARCRTHRYRNAWDLHVKKDNCPVLCRTKLQGLAIDNATFELPFDGRPEDEDLEHRDAVGYCASAPRYYCKFAQIYLLHALHAQMCDEHKTIDVFLVLRRIPPANGKPNCYRRIGLLKVFNEDPDLPSWDEIVEGTIKSRKEEFWLF